MQHKVWTVIPVLERTVWVETSAQVSCSASVWVSATALQLQQVDTTFFQHITVSLEKKKESTNKVVILLKDVILLIHQT